MKTKRPVPGASIKVHGIRGGDLADAPTIAEVVPVLCALLTGRVLVAHGSRIEMSFLREAFESQAYTFRSPVIDTARLVPTRDEPCLRSGDVVSLEYAATRMGLPVHTPHHSLGDAVTTANVFIAAASTLARSGPLSAADMIAYSSQ